MPRFVPRITPVIFAVLISTSLAGEAEIHAGDSEAHMLHVMGEPTGRMTSGGSELFYYDRGIIELRGGKVEDVDLLSVQEAEELRLRRERERVKREHEIKARRARLLQEGTAEKVRVLSDPTFEQQEIRAQVAYWKSFVSRYPDVPVDEQYRVALEKLREQERVERQRAEEERLRAADPGPKPRVSRQKMRKMQRAGTWKW